MNGEPTPSRTRGYPGPSEPRRSGLRGTVQVLLPAGAPALGPAGAQALLDIIQGAHVASRQDGPGAKTGLRHGAARTT